MNDLKLLLLIVAAVTGVVNLIAIGVGITFVLQSIRIAFLRNCTDDGSGVVDGFAHPQDNLSQPMKGNQ